MRRLPTVSDDENLESESAGWLAGVVPEAVALRGLSVEVRGPDTVTLGDPARFRVAVRNRLPVPVSVTLPTSQLWGWQVDGVPEADERGYEPPDVGRTVAFHRGERKVFSTTWDGRVRRSSDEKDGRSDGRGDGRSDGGGSGGSDREDGRSDGRGDGWNDDDGEDGRGDGGGSGGSHEGNVWVDREGRCQFTGYLAADRWEERGLYDRTDVVVRT